MSSPLNFEIGSDGIARIELADPERGNPIDHRVTTAMRDAAIACERAGEAVRAVLITAQGTRFCVGGDLSDFSERGADVGPYLANIAADFHICASKLTALHAPVVVGVQGVAAGGGMGIAMWGDIVVAGASTRFTSAYTKVGLTPDGGSTWFLPRIAGLAVARDLVLTNRLLDAEEAQRLGIVSRIVADESVADEAAAVAEQLAAGPRAAQGRARTMLAEGLQRSLDEQLEIEARSIAEAGASAEGAEGREAFFGERAADFRGIGA